MWKWALIAVLLVAVYTDWRWRKIYNWLTLPALGLGLVLNGIFGGLGGLGNGLLGMLIAFLVFLGLFVFGGMGGGDLKLMAAIGAWLGYPDIVVAMLYVAVVGGVLSIGYAARYGKLREVLRNVYWFFASALVPGGKPSAILAESAAPKFPYGVAIAIGTAITLAYPQIPRLVGG